MSSACVESATIPVFINLDFHSITEITDIQTLATNSIVNFIDITEQITPMPNNGWSDKKIERRDDFVWNELLTTYVNQFYINRTDLTKINRVDFFSEFQYDDVTEGSNNNNKDETFKLKYPDSEIFGYYD